MGEVWRAHDANLDREVAVKLLNPGALADQTSRDRFRREAHVLSRLSHPGVATIYDFDSQGGVDFLVMELVTGGTLESRIAQGALSTADITRIGAQIADALHDAHSRGFLHRDLKPGNIVLTDSAGSRAEQRGYRITALLRLSLGPAPRYARCSTRSSRYSACHCCNASCAATSCSSRATRSKCDPLHP